MFAKQRRKGERIASHTEERICVKGICKKLGVNFFMSNP
jgi:hypothetical protein